MENQINYHLRMFEPNPFKVGQKVYCVLTKNIEVLESFKLYEISEIEGKYVGLKGLDDLLFAWIRFEDKQVVEEDEFWNIFIKEDE